MSKCYAHILVAYEYNDFDDLDVGRKLLAQIGHIKETDETDIHAITQFAHVDVALKWKESCPDPDKLFLYFEVYFDDGDEVARYFYGSLSHDGKYLDFDDSAYLTMEQDCRPIDEVNFVSVCYGDAQPIKEIK